MNQGIIIFLVCVFFLTIFGRILISPLKKILKLFVNSVLGGVLLFIINYFGGIFWGFHIGINIWTSLFVGILGIPGAILLVLTKVFFF